jgi:EAL domain-containing protein (putative c-di-GMP-specific phosphodiesterase class I)/AmiR/NasT family two-component response regulator
LNIQTDKEIHILLVDDEPFILRLMSKMLNGLGYENLSTANDGKSALYKLVTVQSPFDLIICDINMPEMNGIEFMRRSNEANYLGGFILLSGEDSRMLETAYSFASSQNLNILGAIPKPLDRDGLEEILNRFGSLKKTSHTSIAESVIDIEELRRGIRSQDADELSIFYQPRIEVATGKIVSVEALPRWNHAERGLLEPSAFMPLAEQMGLMNELSRKVYKTVVLQIAEWQKKNISLNAAVKLSVNSFEDPEFVDHIIAFCKVCDVDSSQVILEISENDVIQKAAELVEVLMRLRLNRFGVSIDNFGIGYSSTSQLKVLPASELRVLRAFESGAVDNAGARATLAASVALANNLNLEVVAEGAEEKADWDMGEELGVDYIQGGYCSKPLTNSELLEFLQN